MILLDTSPPERLHTAVREAATVCPTTAITLDDQP
ncbi:ferredoxin [Nonomuraea africana]|uniref:Ferredoxin n=1 Tax=Nonomuraea africana TaxID=46171 RepID=A0ABR9K8E0_9ACTN|nr:ferredoxin [Nonomuraea africana]